MALANTVALVIILLLLIFAGFYMELDQLPPWCAWLKYLSYLYWGYSGMMVNEFSGRELPCHTMSKPRPVCGRPARPTGGPQAARSHAAPAWACIACNSMHPGARGSVPASMRQSAPSLGTSCSRRTAWARPPFVLTCETIE